MMEVMLTGDNADCRKRTRPVGCRGSRAAGTAAFQTQRGTGTSW